MIDWFRHFWESLTWGEIAAVIAMILASMAISFASVSYVMVKIPATYFHSDHEHHFLTEKHPLVRMAALTAKNIVGVFLIVLGLILALPGVPGPGFLTFFIGLILTDIPGKRRLEARIIKRPSMLSAVNKLRAKYDRPPLVLD